MSDSRVRHADSEAALLSERELRLAREFEQEGVTLVRTTTPPEPSASNESGPRR